jgi:ABC-2 type transport system permease protein
MRRALIIAKREYLGAVKTKGFVIGLVLAPLMMCGGIIALFALRGQVDTSEKRIAVLDRSGRLGAALVRAAEARNANEVHDEESGRAVKAPYVLEIVSHDPGAADARLLSLSERVRHGELHAFVDIGEDVLHPDDDADQRLVRYHAKGAALDEIRGWLVHPLNDELRRLRLAEAAIEESQVPDLFRWVEVEAMGLVSADPETGQPTEAKKSDPLEAIGVPLAGVILIWIMIMMGASPLLNAVMEEKSQRVAEVLLGCATPFEIMLGKLVGSLGVALTGSAVYLAGVVFVLLQMGALGLFPFHLLPWFLVYVVLAILMVGANSIALGSACNDAKDAQNLTLPSILPMMIPMFLFAPLLKEPNSGFAVVASLLPPFTPVLMLLRQGMPGGVPLWQPWLGLLGMLVFALVLVFAASRIFRVGLLMQGKEPHLGEILRWALHG